jgi:hypothetical protein
MRSALLYVAAFVIVLPALHGAKKHKQPKPPRESINEADLPPLVLLGTGRLDCTISSSEKGRQILKLSAGSGVNFDVHVTPILDGVISMKNGRLTGQSRSMNYRFTSHLADVANFRVTGFGPVSLLALETRVSVNARRFMQPQGPGTTVEFSSDDMDKQGVYIEFRGIFRDEENKRRFAFRTIMGPPTAGGGQVTPMDSNESSRIQVKTVVVEVMPKPGEVFSQITTTLRELETK